MKFCYLDESGTCDELFSVMVGIIVDAYRRRITRKDWSDLLTLLSQILEKPLLEIHTRDFYSGNGIWRNIPGDKRARIINAIFNWLKSRNHKIVYSAVDKDKFGFDFQKETYANEIGSLWRFMALHVCLAIQKHSSSSYEKNKGQTIMIFDKEEAEADKFIKLIINPPAWSDTYYNRGKYKNTERLDNIIDVPYFVDSHHVGLVQVADFVSFFLRKYIEIQMGIPPDYVEEPHRIEEWGNIIINQAIPKSAMYPSKGRCECASLFCRYAPPCLL